MSFQILELAASLVVTSDEGDWSAYKWLVVVGAFAAFAMAWSIGANDMANSFGTAVGARTLKLWQACLIAVIFEFAGAVALGGQVAKTVAGSITSPDYFVDMPEVFAFGMLCALISATIWVTTATYLEYAVSTTHSIIGAVMGFGLVYGGVDSIVWNQTTDVFPYRTGLVTVIIGWFVSPILCSVVSSLLFLLNRSVVLRRTNSTAQAYVVLPPLVFVTVYINVFFVLYKGAKAELNWEANKAGWVAASVAGGITALSIPGTFILKRRTAQFERVAAESVASPEHVKATIAEVHDAFSVEEPPKTGADKMLDSVKRRLLYPVTVDVHESIETDKLVAAMHDGAEVFDPQTEHVYKYLQVFSAICVSFAHGANDVANAAGPLAGIWYVYRNFTMVPAVPVPRWMLVLGGAGLAAGAYTYGYNITKVLGVKMAKMTPSRGYCVQLAVALTVSVASVYGLPISTTHCVVGAEVGVGLVEGLKHGTNWILFGRTCIAWFMTIVITALFSAALFSAGVYSPSLTNLKAVIMYETNMNAQVQAQMSQLQAVAVAMKNTPFDRTDLGLLVNATSNLDTQARNLMDRGKFGQINKYRQEELMEMANQVYAMYTTPVVGYNKSSRANTTTQLIVFYP